MNLCSEHRHTSGICEPRVWFWCLCFGVCAYACVSVSCKICSNVQRFVSMCRARVATCFAPQKLLPFRQHYNGIIICVTLWRTGSLLRVVRSCVQLFICKTLYILCAVCSVSVSRSRSHHFDMLYMLYVCNLRVYVCCFPADGTLTLSSCDQFRFLQRIPKQRATNICLHKHSGLG